LPGQRISSAIRESPPALDARSHFLEWIAEAEHTPLVKRDGPHYYACIAVRGTQPVEAHTNAGSSIGIDMGVENPVRQGL
jgi:hypothetical protein